MREISIGDERHHAFQKSTGLPLNINGITEESTVMCIFSFLVRQVIIRNIYMQINEACLINVPGVDRRHSENLVVMLARLNFSLDFYIYLAVNAKFRREAKLFVLEVLGLGEDAKTRRKKRLLRQLTETRSNDSGAPIMVRREESLTESPRYVVPTSLRLKLSDETLEKESSSESIINPPTFPHITWVQIDI